MWPTARRARRWEGGCGAVGRRQQLQSSGKTGSDGLASLTMTVRGGAQGAAPENVGFWRGMATMRRW